MMKNWEMAFQSYQKYPIIISPNLGIPHFIHMVKINGILPQKFFITLNVIANAQYTPAQISSNLKKHITLLPLLDLESRSQRAKRGASIPIIVEMVSNLKGLALHDTNLHELYELPKEKESYLIHNNFFGVNKRLFSVSVSVALSDLNQVLDRLKTRRFVMCDLVQSFPELDSKLNRICYHSIIFHHHDWNSFKFSHITDLHIAKRFDEILPVLRKKTQKMDELSQLLQVKIPQREDRYRNPNDFFRKYIKLANKHLDSNDLDFIVATGDLIDYYLKNDFKREETYGINQSNWDIFIRILLNLPIPLREDIEPNFQVSSEELQFPILTCTGNHDVRVFGYPLTSLNIFRKLGFTQVEALMYEDPFKRRKFRALSTDRYTLRPYYQFINPFDDYFASFGQKIFIFLNSGGDSLFSFRKVLMGDPDSIGFSDKQLNLVKNVSRKLNPIDFDYPENLNHQIFLLTHAPIANPMIRKVFRRKFAQIFRNRAFFERERYKAHNLRRITKGDGKGNPYLHFDHGVISRNRIEFIKFMTENKVINISGHTHRSHEIQIKYKPQYSKTDENDMEKIDDAAFSFYWDDFSSLPEYSPEFVQKNPPFVIQTPSLGINRNWDDIHRGAFRIYEIEENKITKLGLNFVSKASVKHKVNQKDVNQSQ